MRLEEVDSLREPGVHSQRRQRLARRLARQVRLVRNVRRVLVGEAAAGVEVAGVGVPCLPAALVEDAQVGPGRRVALIELHSAYVRLERVHRLTLLLVKHPKRITLSAGAQNGGAIC